MFLITVCLVLIIGSLYAVNLALSKGVKYSKEAEAFLTKILESLEQQKVEIGDAISNEQACSLHIKTFALKVFLVADNEDRQLKTSMKTAKTFLAAANLMEVLKVFGEIPADLIDKLKYSKWRAADIAKAIRENRPPFIESQEGSLERELDQELETMNVEEKKESSPESSPPIKPASSFSPHLETASQTSQSVNISAPEQPSPQLDHASLQNAEKYARFAISAIQYEDIPTAIKNLKLSLNLLQGHSE